MTPEQNELDEQAKRYNKALDRLILEKDKLRLEIATLREQLAAVQQALEEARMHLAALGWSATGGTNLRDRIDAALSSPSTQELQTVCEPRS